MNLLAGKWTSFRSRSLPKTSTREAKDTSTRARDAMVGSTGVSATARPHHRAGMQKALPWRSFVRCSLPNSQAKPWWMARKILWKIEPSAWARPDF